MHLQPAAENSGADCGGPAPPRAEQSWRPPRPAPRRAATPRQGGGGPPAPRASRKCAQAGRGGARAHFRPARGRPPPARKVSGRRAAAAAAAAGMRGPPALTRRPRGPRPGLTPRRRDLGRGARVGAPGRRGGLRGVAGRSGRTGPRRAQGPCAGRLPTRPEPRGRSRRCAHFTGGTRRLREVRGRGRERRTSAGQAAPCRPAPRDRAVPRGAQAPGREERGREGLLLAAASPSPSPAAVCSSVGVEPALGSRAGGPAGGRVRALPVRTRVGECAPSPISPGQRTE